MTCKQSGLTAFELTVTLAIIAIVAALTMPPYLKWLRSSRLQSAATNLTADLELAKVLAIRESTLVVVDFEASRYTIFVDNGEGGGTPADWNCNGSESIAQIRHLPAGVQIDTDSLSFPTVADKTRFNSRGLPEDIVLPKSISVGTATGSRLITLNRLGKISVQ
ncbi:MAG: GspH/FimT family pseudopilin [Desulfobacterales bacterium]|jgi:Tfp pilus assembly protein FimT